MRALAFMSIAVLFSSISETSACKNFSYEASLGWSRIVFVGRLISVEPLRPTPDGLRPSNAVFEVMQSVKGEIPGVVTITDTGKNCRNMPQFSMDLHKTDEYLVFADVNGDGGYETHHPLANTP